MDHMYEKSAIFIFFFYSLVLGCNDVFVMMVLMMMIMIM